jgi:hypothetical protein
MIEVLKQALEALENVGVLTDREWQAVHKNKANELRQAIAELESQEPVAWKHPDKDMVFWEDTKEVDEYHGFKPTIPLYIHPLQRTWVGLTDGEISEWTPEIHGVIQAIEAKLKEKNCAG